MLCEIFPISLLGSTFKAMFICLIFSLSSTMVLLPATKPINVSKNGDCDTPVSRPRTLLGPSWLLRWCLKQSGTLMVTRLLLTIMMMMMMML